MSNIDLGYNPTPPAVAPTEEQKSNIRAAFKLGSAALADKTDFDIAPADLATALQSDDWSGVGLALSPALPDTVQFVDNSIVFETLEGVVSIVAADTTDLPELNLYRTFKVSSIADYAFAASPAGPGPLHLPAGLEAIGTSAFNSCPNLRGPIIIPPTVSTIGSYAFYLSGFDSFIFVPSSVTYVGSAAFAGTSANAMYVDVDYSVLGSIPAPVTDVYYNPARDGWDPPPQEFINFQVWADYPNLPNF